MGSPWKPARWRAWIFAAWNKWARLALKRHALILELASCHFIEGAENILLSGPTGTGKSHLANAIACEVLKRGHTAYMRSAHRLLTELQAARGGLCADESMGRHRRKNQRLTDRRRGTHER